MEVVARVVETLFLVVLAIVVATVKYVWDMGLMGKGLVLVVKVAEEVA